LTFTGSLMAAGKLQEIKWIPQRPVTYPFQNHINLGLLGLALLFGFALIVKPAAFSLLFPLIIILALAFGVLLIIPIGGADMPTVISLLISYAVFCLKKKTQESRPCAVRCLTNLITH